MDDDELEAIDLEPVDLGPAGDEATFERGRARQPPWIWVGVAAFVAIAAVIAFGQSGKRTRPQATPPTTTVPGPPAQVDRVARLTPVLRRALAGMGSTRWGVVIDDRLYVLDAQRNASTLVPLPEGHVTIDDQSGSSMLASTSEESLVGTSPIVARTLSDRDFPIRAVESGQWWLLGSDGTIRKQGDPAGSLRRFVPTGLRVVAAVPDGFVALNSASGWSLWTGTTVRPISVTGQFLAASATTLAFKNGCNYGGCAVEFFDLTTGTVSVTPLSQIPQFAAFSPDGTRIALASTQGNVVVLDPKGGNVITQTVSLDLPSPSVPFTWTLDGKSLIVVQSHDIEIDRALDGTTAAVIPGTDGVEQVIALP